MLEQQAAKGDSLGFGKELATILRSSSYRLGQCGLTISAGSGSSSCADAIERQELAIET
jgi:hypothetical protein